MIVLERDRLAMLHGGRAMPVLLLAPPLLRLPSTALRLVIEACHVFERAARIDVLHLVGAGIAYYFVVPGKRALRQGGKARNCTH